ncbi:hypothetical protein [Undibacterium sp. Ji22W]|uniref:hypothetical protein n=1 Tax=Undibacterium sp. Ji22W TaxID=3413038 RepID=UPI003BF4072A
MEPNEQIDDEVSLRAYARHRGVALSAVQKAIESGRITKQPTGKISVRLADAQWAANTDVGKRGMDKASDLDGDDLDDEEEAVVPQNSEYQRHRTMREETRSMKERIELDMLMGSVLKLEDATRMVFTSFRTIRDAIMNVPARTKDLLAAETDPYRIEMMLEKELAAALEAIDLKSMFKDQSQDQEETEDGSL